MSDTEYLSVTTSSNAADSVRTALDFVGRDDDMRWKWLSFSVHHALYLYSVAALHNANPDTVASSGRRDDHKVYVQQGDEPRRVVKRVSVPNTRSAYRLTWEEVEAPPALDNGAGRTSDEERTGGVSTIKLIGFWTALARVQDGYYWMGRYHMQRPLVLSDEEMREIAWLTNNVRNRLTHYVPSTTPIDKASVKSGCLVCLKAIRFLISESNSFIFYKPEEKQLAASDTENLIRSLEVTSP